MMLALLAMTGFAASILNAIAGGGAFLTIPVLMLAGLDARAANMTSIVALFPGQLAIAWMARGAVESIPGTPLGALVLASFIGGLAGAALLIATPSTIFAVIVPWLIGISTFIYAVEPLSARRLGVRNAAPLPKPAVLGIAAATGGYGGYFGGGVGFLVIALLTLAGAAPRAAGATKNLLAAVFNATAALVYFLSGNLEATGTAALAAGSIAGGFAGGRLALRLPEPQLRIAIVFLGVVLTGWLLAQNHLAVRP
jgi:uncharacterized membrane protein YfcA